MIDYLTYYYKRGTEPFRSLSALSDGEALQIMKDLYIEYSENILFERFKDPVQYLHDRRQAEHWVREEFLAKGGRPQEAYPISMVLGSSKWIEEHAPNPSTHGEIRVPLSAFTESDVSFTYPDSMVSLWLGRDKPIEYYQPDYHGKVFSLSEILLIVEEKGFPEEKWEIMLPSDVGPYIEAQVWNQKPLCHYRKNFFHT